MTLPTSPISLSQVNVELLKSSTALISLNDTNVRTLAGVASGQIGMNNLQGKTNKFVFTISADVANINLRTVAVTAGWDQVLPVVATIGAGINIYSTSTATTALTIDGAWAGGVTLVNNGNIVGKGGAGGSGGNPDTAGGTQGNGTSGTAGGKALAVTVAVSIDNTSGIIGGGGGGGGGGGASYTSGSFGGGGNTYTAWAGGGGGNGGAGVGSGGSRGTPTGGDANAIPYTATAAVAGGTGTYIAPGSGGAGGISGNLHNSAYGGDGGAGGSLGTAGSAAGAASYSAGGSGGGPIGSAGSGGAAGACLTGNANITWIATGTRYGTIS